MRTRLSKLADVVIILSLAAPVYGATMPADPLTTLVDGNAGRDFPRVTRPADTNVADVEVAGHYAYAAVGPQLETWDLHSPNHPLLVALSPAFGAPITDLAISGGNLYLLAGGLYTFNLVNPVQPALVSSLTTPIVAGATRLALAGVYVYVGGPSGVAVVNMSDPANPSTVGSLGSGSVSQLTVVGLYLYILEPHTLQIAWLSNPTAPTIVGSLPDTWYYAGGMVLAVGYLYVVDPLALYVVNINNPSAPAVANTLTRLGGTAVTAVGSLLYIALNVGIGTYNLSSPLAPRAMDVWVQTSGPLNRLTPYGNNLYGATTGYAGSVWMEIGLAPSGVSFNISPTFGTNVAGPPGQPITGPVHLYLPAVLRGINLSIAGLEVTQVIQRPDDSVPLVGGRPAVVRVYAHVRGAAIVDGIAMTLAGTRGGVPLPGSPLTIDSWAVFDTPDKGLYSQSFNFDLPDTWTSGTIVLTATVNPTRTVAEADPNDNMRQVTVNFAPMPPLAVMIIPVNYHDTANGKTYPGMSEDTLSAFVRRLFPISALNVSLHAPIDFVGSLAGSGWFDLLHTINLLKSAEGAPTGEIYYGSIPVGDWATGGTGGVSEIGQRLSVGIDYGPAGADGSGQTAAHEFGHNLGLLHAPCGDALVPDPAYPYPNASIGQYGYDPVRELILPPNLYVDVMSYCNPVWISDYSYIKLYHDQMLHGAVTAASDTTPSSLLIRASFDRNGRPTLLPIYRLSSPADTLPAFDDYSVQLVSASGDALATYFVSVTTPVSETPVMGLTPAMSWLSVRVPMPTEPVAAVRLRRAGTVLARRALNAPSQAARPQMSVLANASGAVVEWTPRDQPALVRYSLDNGQTWTTIGLDATGGQLPFNLSQLAPGDIQVAVSWADQANEAIASLP